MLQYALMEGGGSMNLILSDKLKHHIAKKNVNVLTVDQVDLKHC